ncbi:hypothetical protein SGPA1_41005 [Streptomyces misionensis JCM 4497]
MAGRRVPGDQGPRGGPLRLRPDHPGRRLHHRAHRFRAGGARHTGAQGGRRLRLRARRVHRLRGVRGRLPQRRGDAVHLREDQPPQRAAAGRARAGDAGARHGGADGRGGLRRLHADRRVRDRLPQGHPADVHHEHEQGVAARDPQGREALVRPFFRTRSARVGGALRPTPARSGRQAWRLAAPRKRSGTSPQTFALHADGRGRDGAPRPRLACPRRSGTVRPAVVGAGSRAGTTDPRSPGVVAPPPFSNRTSALRAHVTRRPTGVGRTGAAGRTARPAAAAEPAP